MNKCKGGRSGHPHLGQDRDSGLLGQRLAGKSALLGLVWWVGLTENQGIWSLFTCCQPCDPGQVIHAQGHQVLTFHEALDLITPVIL